MVGQFSWIADVHTTNNIEWSVIDGGIDVSTRRAIRQNLSNGNRGIAGRVWLRSEPVHHQPINQAPPKAQYRAGPPRAHRPASAGRDVRQQGLTTWHCGQDRLMHLTIVEFFGRVDDEVAGGGLHLLGPL